MKSTLRIAALFFVASAAASIASAQVTIGTPPFAAIGGGPADKINLANLNVHFDIPVLNKAGRGAAPFTYDIAYDSSIWQPVTVNGTKTWEPTNAGALGWSFPSNGTIRFQVQVSEAGFWCGSEGYVPVLYYTANLSFVDRLGTAHPLPGYIWSEVYTCNQYYQDSGDSGGGTATDGSGYTLSFNSSGYPVVTAKDGTVVYNPNATTQAPPILVDSNGNEITTDNNGNFFDTLSSTTPVLTVSGTAPNPTKFTYTAPNNQSAYYTMKYTTVTVKTDFQCSGVTEFPATQENLVSEIDLPDISTNPSDKYTFTYEQTPDGSGDYTGRIASVTLPTGGTINYTYSGPNDGIVCADGSTSGLTRQVTPGGTWTYTRAIGSGAASTTTITDPQNNQTVMDFQGIYPTEADVYQGAVAPANLLKTTYTCYNGSTSPCDSTAITLPIAQKTVLPLWANGQKSKTKTTYNYYGMVSEVDDYDYGNGAPGPLLRKTLYAYNSGVPSDPTSISIEDASGNVVASTDYSYDQTLVTTTSGTPQHVSVANSTLRGNLTSIGLWVSGSRTLTSSFTYYDTGNIQTATDVNNAQTSYTYGDCGNSFVTSISGPLLPATSEAWNCTGGVETSATDENGQTTTTSYGDPNFWRPTSTTDAENNQTSITYNPYSGLTSVEKAMPISGSSEADVLTTVDDLGRPELTQTREAPGSSTFDTVETDYDSDGRPDRTTLPYAASAGSTCSSCAGTTITSYDALGRPLTAKGSGGGTITYSYQGNDVLETLGPQVSGENVKSKQLEYDALGRLTSVCEITSGSGSGPCPQTRAETGYYTQYTYDALGDLTGVSQDSGAQTRWFTYDGLGRMTTETNPESGTTTYTYDTDSTCGTSNGDLVKKVDAVGNLTCYAYDALHRVTSITYSGPYAAATPNKYFVYDSATVNGVAMVNTEGRLAEAYTCFSPCSTKITDEGFSYTKRGEVSDVYELTPHSGGYVHSNATFWANGALETLNDSAGYNLSFGVDGEGRPSSSTDASGGHPLASTTYDPASQPTQLNFGYTGDNDYYTYDQNTGRMLQYKFTVNSQSLIGNLTWNANGTLAKLAITDPFNSADAQSCDYTHDDLARLASVSCSGSGWSQTFGYDAFGNVTVTGSGPFQPGYNSKNQMLSPATYDANGNATSDEQHTYAWDADGQPVTIDGVAITYDALGRIVEEDNSGTYSELIYSPTGFKMQVMSGGSSVAEYAPMPGGGASVWTASGFYYRHGDWLGSSRFASTKSQTVYYDAAYAPFGQSYAQTGTADNNFTGKDQGTVSGLYDFPAREYNDREGRWVSPDPAGLASVNPADPQSWNRYAYVRNSPLGMTDPMGLAYTVCYVDAGCVIYSDTNADSNTCGPDYFGCFGPPLTSVSIGCDQFPYALEGDCQLPAGTEVCDPSTSPTQCGLSFGVGSPSQGPPLPVGAGGGALPAPQKPQSPSSSKPPLSQRAKTYFTQYVPCAMEGFWLTHFLGDKEHTEAFLTANVFIPAGAAAKWGPWGVLVGATGAAAYDFKAAIETNKTCTAQVYGSQQ